MTSTGNTLFTGASGTLDNIVVKRYGDKTIITKRPDMSRRKLSPKQKESNERMRIATLYARNITASDRLKQRACDFLKVPPNKVFRALVSHYMLSGRVGESWLFPETPRKRLDEHTRKELKTAILSLIPDAVIMLFGDKAKGSDDPNGHWDLLILTSDDHPAALKWELHEKLFAITAQQGTNIDMILTQQEKWNNGKEYELLKKRIEKELVVLA